MATMATTTKKPHPPTLLPSQRTSVTNNNMIVSIADEMNATRRNTMEDVHVFHGPGTWNCPNDNATFIGVYDGHGGRLIVDYLEDHLASNVASEWSHMESERKKDESAEKEFQRQKKRRLDATDDRDNNNSGGKENQPSPENDNDKEGKLIRTSLERSFLITDIQSRMAGLTTSGATVVCCVVIPKFSSVDGSVTSIMIHAANAGDARAVLSSCNARKTVQIDSIVNSAQSTVELSSDSSNNIICKPSNLQSDATAIRLTCDHKSTDPEEIARIESSGGVMIRGRVLGVLAVARSLGDHGLKEFVIGRPYLSSTVVHVDGKRGQSALQNTKSGEREVTSMAPALSSPFTDGEFLIVACDGLWDVMEDQDAVDLVRNYTQKIGLKNRQQNQKEVASFLVDEALRRGSSDNITVVVYWL